MMMLWTEAWQEQQASPSSDTVELWSLELLHPAIVDPQGNRTSVRAVNDDQDHELPLEDSALLDPGQAVLFKAIPFGVPLPEIEEGRTPQIRIRVDNIGREIVPHLDAAMLVDAPLTIVMRCHLWKESDGSIVAAMDPVTMETRDVSVNEQYVEGTASPADLANLQFGRVIYDVENYPALTQA